ncbi:MAG: hypothetical protein IIZ92_13030 [Aquincola sp.]|nr:hypothetical protein [Aquincola sp.]
MKEAAVTHPACALVTLTGSTATGAHIAWSVTPQVRTSARRQARARGGFADFLLGLELTQPCAQPGG